MNTIGPVGRSMGEPASGSSVSSKSWFASSGGRRSIGTCTGSPGRTRPSDFGPCHWSALVQNCSDLPGGTGVSARGLSCSWPEREEACTTQPGDVPPGATSTTMYCGPAGVPSKPGPATSTVASTAAAANPPAASPRQRRRSFHHALRAEGAAAAARGRRAAAAPAPPTLRSMRGQSAGDGSTAGASATSGCRRSSQASTAARSAASCGRRASTERRPAMGNVPST